MKIPSILASGALALGVSGADAVLSKNVFAVDHQVEFSSHMAGVDKFLAEFPSRNSFQDYLELLEELSDPRYRVLSGKEFAAYPADPEHVTVYFRHDIDHDPQTAVKMAEAEAKLGLRGSYYILSSALYYGKVRDDGKLYHFSCMDDLYRSLAAGGHELGVHTDLLTIMFYYHADPLAFQRQELAYYRSIGLEITGCVSHGSPLNPLGLNNTFMFSEFGRKGSYEYKGEVFHYGQWSLADYGFAYEGYRLKANVRLSDISAYPGWEIKERLRQCKPGDRVSLLVHPLHWKDEKRSGK